MLGIELFAYSASFLISAATCSILDIDLTDFSVRILCRTDPVNLPWMSEKVKYYFL